MLGPPTSDIRSAWCDPPGLTAFQQPQPGLFVAVQRGAAAVGAQRHDGSGHGLQELLGHRGPERTAQVAHEAMLKDQLLLICGEQEYIDYIDVWQVWERKSIM